MANVSAKQSRPRLKWHDKIEKLITCVQILKLQWNSVALIPLVIRLEGMRK